MKSDSTHSSLPKKGFATELSGLKEGVQEFKEIQKGQSEQSDETVTIGSIGEIGIFRYLTTN